MNDFISALEAAVAQLMDEYKLNPSRQESPSIRLLQRLPNRNKQRQRRSCRRNMKQPRLVLLKRKLDEADNTELL